MKKAMRKMICMVLVGLLTVSTVVPAMAGQEDNSRASGTGTVGTSYDYAWDLTYTATNSTGSVRTTRIDHTVKVVISSYVYDEINGVCGYSEPVESVGYRSTTASAGRIFEINDVLVDGEVWGTVAQFWVAGNLALTIYEGDRNYAIVPDVYQ